jgi:hypothetical protein
MFWANIKKTVRRISNAGDASEVCIPEDIFLNLLEAAIHTVDVDEEWYLRQYPDVAASLEVGSSTSAKEHYIRYGYFEGRMPRELQVDEVSYVEQNADVAEAIRRGSLRSARQHFNERGPAEGRLPSKGFSLFSRLR